ncbi:MAG: DUF2924 domain-containing protein [Caulobacterales bacterium]
MRSLESMNLAALKDVWRGRWGPPPKLRSVELLRLIIAWRMQAAAEGSLSGETKARLRSTSIPRTPNPPAGTRLTREYRGVLYTVEILAGGVRHAGRTYRSLSEVAREITGTRWNGPRFFGLRNRDAA